MFWSKPAPSSNHDQHLLNNNLYYLKWLSLLRSLYFIVPVWVSMELQYISLTQVAMIEMVILTSGLLLELPTGALADLIGRKSTIVTSFLVGAVAYAGFAYATDFTGFLLAGLGFGLADALLSGSLEALVFDTLKQNKQTHLFSEVNNQNQLLFNYGIVFAIVTGGFMFAFNYYLPSLLTALAFVGAGWLATHFIEPDIDSEKFTWHNYLRQTKLGFKELFKNQQARDISLFYILVGGLSWPIVITFKNFALVDLGMSEQHMGLVIALTSLLAVQFLHVLIRKKVFQHLAIAFMLPTLLLAIALPLSFFYNIPAMVVLIFAIFLTSSMRWSILGKLSNQCYSSKNRTTAISSLSMLISLIYIAILGLFSWLNQHSDQAIRNIFLLLAAASWILLLPIAIKLARDYHGRELIDHD